MLLLLFLVILLTVLFNPLIFLLVMKKFLKIKVVGQDGSVLYSNDVATPQVLMAVFECFSSAGTVVTSEVCEFTPTSDSTTQK